MKAELNAQLDEQEAERELTLTCRVSRRWLALNAVLVVAIGAVLFLPAPGAAAAVKPVTVYAATKPTAVYAAEPTLAAGFAVQTAPAEDRDDDHPPWMAPTPPRHQQHKLQHPNASAADGDGPASQAVTADERCTLRAACPSSRAARTSTRSEREWGSWSSQSSCIRSPRRDVGPAANP